MSLVILLPIILVALCMVSACAFVMYKLNTTPSPNGNDAPPSSVETIQDGSMYTISRSGTYIGQDFDRSRGKGKMCDAASTGRDGAAPFKFSKDGDAWTIATDCDGDGKYTSFLNGSSDLISARDKKSPTMQRWYVACSASGCSLQNKKSKKYLGGTFTAPTFEDSGTFYIVRHA